MRYLVVAALAGLVVIGPWWIHQFATFGMLSPSAAGGRSLWIINLDDFNRIAARVQLIRLDQLVSRHLADALTQQIRMS